MGDWEPIRYASNAGVSIAYTTVGGGRVDLIWIPGFVSHLEVLKAFPATKRFWDRLATFSRVILFDKRGTGLSDRDNVYTLENVVDDALAVLDAVGSDRAVVFGVSEGGSAATMLAATHPERVVSMIQYGTYARISEAPDYPEGIPVETLRAFWGGMIDNWGSERTLSVFAPSLAGDVEATDFWARLLRSGASPGGARGILEMYERLDVRPLLPTVRVPTLVLHRAGDQLIRPEMSRLVAAGIPNARSVELPGRDHLFAAGDTEPLLAAAEEFVTGEVPAVVNDRMLATVLFTDIVDSTRRAAELGDARWRDILERHARLAEREVTRYRGRVIKSTGDGILATFDGPARAVRSALAMRDGARALDLELRAGLHTGECELVADDVAGIAVHLASRVESAAEPGEVLTSSTVRDLVVGSGLEFQDRGRHALKGVPGEWALFAVAGDHG